MLPPPLLTPLTERTVTPDMLAEQEETQRGQEQEEKEETGAAVTEAEEVEGGKGERLSRPSMPERESSSRISFQTAYEDEREETQPVAEDREQVGQGKEAREEQEMVEIGGIRLGKVVPAGTTGAGVLPSTTGDTGSGIGSGVPTTPTSKIPSTSTKPSIAGVGVGGIPITPSKSISSVTPTAADRLAREQGARVRSGSITIGAIRATTTTQNNNNNYMIGTSPSSRPSDLITANPPPPTTTTTTGNAARRSSIVEASGAGLKAWWNSFTGGSIALEEDGNQDPPTAGAGGLRRQMSRPRGTSLCKEANTRFPA